MTKGTESGPMGQMNTTPLIDVMLVLLIMFIITIPVATHSIDVDIPTGCDDCPVFDSVQNKIVIDDGDRLLWNGTPITNTQLAGLLEQTLQLPVEPELQFEPAARASYAASARTLRTIEASGVTRFGFLGNERYRTFAYAD